MNEIKQILYTSILWVTARLSVKIVNQFDLSPLGEWVSFLLFLGVFWFFCDKLRGLK